MLIKTHTPLRSEWRRLMAGKMHAYFAQGAVRLHASLVTTLNGVCLMSTYLTL